MICTALSLLLNCYVNCCPAHNAILANQTPVNSILVKRMYSYLCKYWSVNYLLIKSLKR